MVHAFQAAVYVFTAFTSVCAGRVAPGVSAPTSRLANGLASRTASQVQRFTASHVNAPVAASGAYPAPRSRVEHSTVAQPALRPRFSASEAVESQLMESLTAVHDGTSSDATVAPAVSRRSLAVGSALSLPFATPQGAVAIPRVTDIRAYINNRKITIIPVFKQGMDYLEKYGVDERMTLFAPKMARKMELYASMFSMTEAPDRTVRRLEADAKAFLDAVVEKKDKAAAKAAFEVYRSDIPSSGFFDLNDPQTYEAPPP